MVGDAVYIVFSAPLECVGAAQTRSAVPSRPCVLLSLTYHFDRSLASPTGAPAPRHHTFFRGAKASDTILDEMRTRAPPALSRSAVDARTLPSSPRAPSIPLSLPPSPRVSAHHSTHRIHRNGVAPPLPRQVQHHQEQHHRPRRHIRQFGHGTAADGVVRRPRPAARRLGGTQLSLSILFVIVCYENIVMKHAGPRAVPPPGAGVAGVTTLQPPPTHVHRSGGSRLPSRPRAGPRESPARASRKRRPPVGISIIFVQALRRQSSGIATDHITPPAPRSSSVMGRLMIYLTMRSAHPHDATQN